MNCTLKTMLGVFACSLIPLLAAAQTPEESLLASMTGTWEGEGSMVMGPGSRSAFVQQEWIRPTLGGRALFIEGLGRAADDTSRVVHRAVALLVPGDTPGRYTMHAFRDAGAAGVLSVQADAHEADGKLVWGYDDPRAGRVRYTIWLDAQGQWRETGEASRDGGATWFPFLDMTLRRVQR